MFATFRSFVEYLEIKGQLVRKKDPVSLSLEVNQIAKASIEAKGSAILFENVVGTEMPIVAGLFGTRERVFQALGTTAETFSSHFSQKLKEIDNFPGKLVKEAPVKEKIITEDFVDINYLPFAKHGALDGGWYISSGICIGKDPNTSVRNVSFHRLMKHSERKIGLWMSPTNLHRIVHSYWTQGKPCPIAVVIGADPYTLLAACTNISPYQEEFSLAGALKGEPIELIPCESIPLEVPANAEIALEGWVHPGEELEEGPFAETSGYYSRRKRAPVITVTAITHRGKPIFQNIVTGIPPDENQAMLVTQEAMANELAIHMFPKSVLDVYLTPGGCTSFNAIVKIRKKFAGEAKQVGVYLLTVMSRLKSVWMVDENIDSHNPVQVEWAYATRCRGERDMTILKGMRSVPLDPCAVNGVVDKVVFDCTTPLPEERILGEEEHIPCL